MNVRTFVVSLGVLALLAAFLSVEARAGEQDDAILALVLQRHYDDGGFTVVGPTTSLGRGQRDPLKLKKYVKDKLGLEGYDIGPLLDKFIEKNREPIHSFPQVRA